MCEYITVAEYARIRGVSTAAVYKRLDGSLKPWVTVINGKKRLLKSVLEDEVENTSNEDNKFQTKIDDVVDNGLIDALRGEMERLRAENEAQRQAIQEKDRQLAEYATRFADLAQQAQALVAQAQQLHALDKPRLTEAETPQDAQEQTGEPDDREYDHGADQPPQTGKRGLWARIFG